MQYGHVYVAKVAFGAKDSQTISAFREAESYNGPALIIAYSHCIAHGFPLHLGLGAAEARGRHRLLAAVPLRPAARRKGARCLSRLDSDPPKSELSKFTANETRFGILRNIAPERAAELGALAQAQVKQHYALYQQLAAPFTPSGNGTHHRLPRPLRQPRKPRLHGHEPRNHLSRAEAQQPPHCRRLALLRQVDVALPASGRRRLPPSSCARSSRSRSRPSSGPWSTTSRPRQRAMPRRRRISRPFPSTSWPRTSYLRRSRA